MKKYWIDANVILRYLLEDHEQMSPKAKEIMVKVEKREISLLVAVITIAYNL